MFRKNPLVELELNYLREVFPNRWWQYLLLVPAYVMVYLPLVNIAAVADHYFLLLGFVCFVVLGTFWVIQLGITRVSVHMMRRPYTEDEEALVAGYGASEILLSKFWAMFQHTRVWQLLWIPLTMISTKTLLLFMFGEPQAIWIFDAVDRNGIVPGIDIVRWWDNYYSDIGIFTMPMLVLIPLLAISATSMLSIAIGFYFANRSRLPIAIACISRVSLLVIAFFIMLLFSSLRFTWLKHVVPDGGIPYPYTPFEESARLVLISLEVSASTMLDNGTLGMTIVADCLWNFKMYSYPYVVRNLIAMGVGIMGQLGLAGFLLWRTSRGMGKKKN